MREFKVGDRVAGLYRHRGRVGVLLDVGRSFVKIKWDDASRASHVQIWLIDGSTVVENVGAIAKEER